ncbi:VOC family protein [Rhizobium sp. L51/94]|uniref:VOC family protein n=1 Tax=Rhizobium sp. L51/94 TaxID=2819999 RepID=UPI001C5AE1B8|nr:glyoxalase [Rhizobium sp. L51/94]QXZ80982.1 glyoxalase [Rhizobium sp. L51/94]
MQTTRARALRLTVAVAMLALPPLAAFADDAGVAVGPQYDTTHVYLDVGDVDRFIASFTATFGGTSTKQVVATVTPTPSSTTSQLIQTPAGLVSLFGFKTPIPYPFGTERTGYLVKDLDSAIAAARKAGAAVVVDSYPDPIGRDAIVQWPGGVNMQLYWHTKAPAYAPLQTVPENRVYLSPDVADVFVADFVKFSQGRVVSDTSDAAGTDIGRDRAGTYRRIQLESAFGTVTVLVTDGHLPYPFGRETTGYEVTDLEATLGKATASGATILVPPFAANGREAAMVEFPGGYISEIHSVAER